ncbi:aldehyde-activating protein [Lysobacter sp. LF1]|uniref:Aldehyde-activating protein n=1 Tax=Lysobacter stagni TaxID=3045172 RepID=A0ABT6XDF7_9GAMM|nr:aldehyde-activating protein [Lysobacter sp. LF1]MDI9238172.1 aldehyde-activating protein [Lysobacter sp. LF1]
MNTTPLRGGCHCGRLGWEARLSQSAATLSPRACDCSFCTKHGAVWFSDAHGSVHLRLRGEPLRYRQGSAQAEFIACSHCAVLVMVTCLIDERTHAALNARTVDGPVPFAPEQPASPQRLDADDKRERWSQLWFPDVRFDYVDD